MKAYLIKKLTFFGDDSNIDTFHYTMFHGLAEKDDDGVGVSSSYVLGDDLRCGLRLTVNAYRIQNLFQPKRNFVVSQVLRDMLAGFSGFEFLKAQLKKVIWARYDEGNFDHWNDPQYRDPGNGPELFIEGQPDRDDLKKNLPKFYEIICPNYYKVLPQFSNLNEYTSYIGPTEFDPKFSAKLSSQMVSFYPMLKHASGTIVNEQVFEVLEPFFDWHYFLKAEFDLKE